MLLGAVVGALLRRLLPDHHLDDHARDIVRLGAGLVGTIAAMVLGLLINSANSSYEAQRGEIRQIAANHILLDAVLDQYGEEAKPTRVLLATEALLTLAWGPPREGNLVAGTWRRQGERTSRLKRSKGLSPADRATFCRGWLASLPASPDLFDRVCNRVRDVIADRGGDVDHVDPVEVVERLRRAHAEASASRGDGGGVPTLLHVLERAEGAHGWTTAMGDALYEAARWKGPEEDAPQFDGV
jgi:hypothetical protein